MKTFIIAANASDAARAEVYLVGLGYDPVNPFKTTPTDTAHIDKPRHVDRLVASLRRLSTCGAVLLVSGHEQDSDCLIYDGYAVSEELQRWAMPG